MGITQSNQNLGLECVGLISRVGANREHNFQLGDFVLCWSPGSLATHVLVDANYCIKLPDNLPFGEAVTLPTVYANMIRGLKELCNLVHGESVLIHSSVGADGIAAIQVAQMIGAKVRFVLSRSSRVLRDSCRFLSLPPRMSRKVF
jgi:NADPH:quinone reductase-like Zn-dependent oxidoreductase